MISRHTQSLQVCLRIETSKKEATLDQSSTGKTNQSSCDAKVSARYWGDSQAKKDLIVSSVDQERQEHYQRTTNPTFYSNT